MTTTILAPNLGAWHNSPALKTEVTARMATHRAADTLVQAVYQERLPNSALGYRGCFLGCTLPWLAPIPQDPTWAEMVERYYAIPATVGDLVEATFENLREDRCGAFAFAVVDAIPIGADLSLVIPAVNLDLLTDPVYGVTRFTTEGSAQHTVITQVADLLGRVVAGGAVTPAEWQAANTATEAAVWTAHDEITADATTTAQVIIDHWGAVEASGPWREIHYTQAPEGSWQWLAGRVLHHLAATQGGQR
ncbi:MAG: hypothetical protein ACRDRO_04025 [Pseudonocardiaceae bacterium]